MRVATVIVAINTQQKLGIAVAFILAIGWLGFILVHVRHGTAPRGAEMELAPANSSGRCSARSAGSSGTSSSTRA